MDGKNKEVKEYLTDTINPLLKPMVEAIVAARPNDIFAFIKDYAHQQISISILNRTQKKRRGIRRRISRTYVNRIIIKSQKDKRAEIKEKK